MLLDFPRSISICLPFARKSWVAKLVKETKKKWLKSYVFIIFYALLQLVEKYKIAMMFFCQMLNFKCTIVIYYGVNRVVDLIEST
jgi:hypothetical protein